MSVVCVLAANDAHLPPLHHWHLQQQEISSSLHLKGALGLAARAPSSTVACDREELTDEGDKGEA